MAVALFDSQTPLAPLRKRLLAVMEEVVDGGAYVLGPNVEAFEAEFARYLGARHAVGVANGTEALTIALRALGVGPGDEVVVPSFSFFATAEAVPPTGATPVFCDIDPATYCVTVDTVRAALTPRTRAIVAVHLFGNVAPVRELEAELGLPVVEDAAQAAGSLTADGARPGALGSIATFSFYPSKNLGAFGDGGAVTTSDAALDEAVRTLRFHGSPDRETYAMVGYNSRLDELQAAVLRVLLPELDGWADARRAAGEAYAAAGLGDLVTLPSPVAGALCAWHVYVVASERADELAAGLRERGIGCKAYYRVPIHRQPAMAAFAPRMELPGTAAAARRHLAIPMGAALGARDVAEVVAAVRGVLNSST